MIVEDEAIWIIMADNDSVATAKSDQLFEQSLVSVGTGRHIRVVCPHQFNAGEAAGLPLGHDLLQRVEVGLPAVRHL